MNAGPEALQRFTKEIGFYTFSIVGQKTSFSITPTWALFCEFNLLFTTIAMGFQRNKDHQCCSKKFHDLAVHFINALLISFLLSLENEFLSNMIRTHLQ